MFKFFAQDLFQPSNGSSPSSPSNTNVVTTTTTNTNFFSDWNINDFLFNLNLYTLLWSVMISFILISNFYFYYRKFGDMEFEREEKGEKSLWKSAYTWIRYLLCWGLIFAANYFGSGFLSIVFGVIAILVVIIKFWFDILDIISTTDYFPWFADFIKVL
jgi:peptidoglycan/LPS O-acetylase OafA/YrhL